MDLMWTTKTDHEPGRTGPPGRPHALATATEAGIPVTTATISVLLIEDDRDDYLLTSELLAEIDETGYTVRWVDNYEDGAQALLAGGFELCLLDYRLGAHTGLDLLREVSARGCTIPIVLLTGQSERELD